MKKIYFSLFLALLFSLPVLANNVIVKGQVKFSNGSPAVNFPVRISTDSSSTPSACMQAQVVYTNANGYYIDTLHCSSANIVKVQIGLQNCDGTYLVENPQVNTATNLVERNFTICQAQHNCEAKFVSSTANLNVAFYSQSTASTGSTITGYAWSFGDGSSSTAQHPTHSYANAGTYQVYLVITTSSGCKDTANASVTVINATGTCHAMFRDSAVNGNKFFFFSNGSTTATGDSIIQRIWNFGDGHTSSGNYNVADHIYQVSGTYNVCLKIVTKKGCIDSVCKTITAVAPATGCMPVISYQRIPGSNPYSIAFNSSASKGSTATDSIVSRFWTFGDGQQLSGNVVSPNHSYTSPGNYQVCLKITTAAGCQKNECKMVYLGDSGCQAKFSYDIMAGGKVKFYNSSSTAGTTAQYFWNFGDGRHSAAKDTFLYYAPGTYTACLKIMTAAGCVDSVCKTFTIPAPSPNCEATFSYTGLPTGTAPGFGIRVNSSGSHASSMAGDSIITRTWIWGDGSTGNGVDPAHYYTAAGTYNVCLVITTKKGCSDTVCKTIKLPLDNQVNCQPKFSYEHLPATSAAGRSIRFNSAGSVTITGDSIISRKWEFGNGATLTGNVVNPVYTYPNPGSYYVCLTIKTAMGCEKKECKLVVIPQSAGGCVPHFSWQRSGPKQVTFNSASSWVPANDSIIERRWHFGDTASALGGNVIAPVHNYLHQGVYTVTLKIRTKLNCEKTFWLPVVVQDSTSTPPNQERIKIVSLYPTPATTQMQAVVWSMQNNVQAELAVYDVYGVKKWSISKLLLQGNNVTVIPTGSLPTGPYYFRVTTIFGVKSKPFFKQ